MYIAPALVLIMAAVLYVRSKDQFRARVNGSLSLLMVGFGGIALMQFTDNVPCFYIGGLITVVATITNFVQLYVKDLSSFRFRGTRAHQPVA